MKKGTLYSSSDRRRRPLMRVPQPARADAADATRATAAEAGAQNAAPPARPSRWSRFRAGVRRHDRILLLLAGGLFVAFLAIVHAMLTPAPRDLTQHDIDAAVTHSLDTMPPNSQAAKAYEAVIPSVVRVLGIAEEHQDGKPAEKGIGTGVVILENGVILTNLHVVAGAKTIKVTFYDGFESEADVVSLQPENDLAVLKARNVPDDLPAATLRSTGDLRPGDEVVAVGFPFGIGPSASAGVISGLGREYRSPEGKRVLTNLIQFDAAANPGNSGGPLVTMDGEVVGIVTAILNPTEQRVFVGIGFAVPIENAASAVGLSPF